jgi:hypothetical protein
MIEIEYRLRGRRHLILSASGCDGTLLHIRLIDVDPVLRLNEADSVSGFLNRKRGRYGTPTPHPRLHYR